MSTLVVESFTVELPTHRGRIKLLETDVLYKIWMSVCKAKESILSLQKPAYSHDRTFVTIIVLLCGTGLLWHYGDAAPIVALVSSGWTLALTFWFRLGVDPASPDR